MTDRNPTLEAMVEEMRRAAAPFMVRGLEGCSTAYDYPLLPPKEKARIDEVAKACASIAQKEIERVTAMERAGAELATVAFNLAQQSHLLPNERLALKRGQEAWDKARAALNERPAQ